MTTRKLLNDEQVREFIANGFLRLTPDVDANLHKEIEALLRFAVEKEGWYGNNILARVPKMYQVLNCPVVHGAVSSIAGPDYYLHPHRAVHNSTPLGEAGESIKRESLDAAVNAPPMGKGSRAGSGWHQDAQSPLSRARHHLPRYLIGFYFPHETPVAMGPTRIQAGSHLYANPVEPNGVVLQDVPAGTFFLLHFDMVHAGFPNFTNKTRYMVKFVFTRTRHADEPSWRHADARWRRPAGCIAEYDAPTTWTYIWNWMRGAPQAPTNGGTTPEYLARFNSAEQPTRLESIYAAAGSDAVDALVQALLANAGANKHERTLAKDKNGQPIPRDDVRGFPRRWNERAVVMEDAAYALAACGAAAVPALEALLAHEDPWMQINAMFALGELGGAAKGSVPKIADLLHSPVSQVVRQTLDTLGAIGTGLAPALPKIERLLSETNWNWQEAQVTRGWVAEDQVRMNAALALLNAVNSGEDLAAIERIASAALGDKNGYVSAIATEVLTRIGTPTAQAAAIRFLAERRWDDTLMAHVKPF